MPFRFEPAYLRLPLYLFVFLYLNFLVILGVNYYCRKWLISALQAWRRIGRVIDWQRRQKVNRKNVFVIEVEVEEI
ncbi:hypothetical protein TYRP_019885 [Tyrophagus putrescentiae]|nr:hypothetical protein TYRP_019885 [Tyrophagus putrescentiae]